jgi:hypothetical protein
VTPLFWLSGSSGRRRVYNKVELMVLIPTRRRLVVYISIVA